MRRAADAGAPLVAAARPVMTRLARAVAGTRYFAILTDAAGIVVDVQGPVDRQDRRADLIARVGVDLSEHAVGTTAIGTVLAEHQSVWLHRGEHFFADTGAYSCAGAPLFDPQGRCMGMLDLTGVDVPERPELRHLVTQSARSIENALLLAQGPALVVHLNWPGRLAGDESDALLALDADGVVTGSNAVARDMLVLPPASGLLHCTDLLALPWATLADAARRAPQPLDAPLWSGLRLQVLVRDGSRPASDSRLPLVAPASSGLRDVEEALIRQAVEAARGNVAEAARALGISRATVYRKLGARRSRSPAP
jgi:transcriptional regulator of acetoin/glycerol metabolism